MAATTNEGTPSQADELTLVPFHLCYEGDDAFDSDDGALSLDNVRSHAEVPEPDFHGLPPTDCVVYRGEWTNANLRGVPADVAVIVCGDTSASMAFSDAKRKAKELSAERQVVLAVEQPVSRGMGWQSTVRFVQMYPRVTGCWYREVDLATAPTLPPPPRVPAEAVPVRATTAPPARWVRITDARDLCRQVGRRIGDLAQAEERGAA